MAVVRAALAAGVVPPAVEVLAGSAEEMLEEEALPVIGKHVESKIS